MALSNLFRYNPVKSFIYSTRWKCKARIGYNVKINNKGSIKVLKNSYIRIEKNCIIEIRNEGILVFKGNAYLGDGTRFIVGNNGKFTIGDDFSCSGRSDFGASKAIEIGESCRFSVNLQIMDTDYHKILNKEDIIINNSQNIKIGNKVWVGCTSTILKGSNIPDNVIIGANSLVTNKNVMESNYIYAGCPIKKIKDFKNWIS